MNTTLLLDADIVAFKITSVTEQRVDWDGDGNVQQMPADMAEIETLCDEAIDGLKRKFRTERLIVCSSCDSVDGFRKDFYPAYKEHRAASMRPIHLIAAKQYMAREHESFARPRLEADDIMGILSTDPKLIKGKKIIVSEDKDMKTIPGWLYNPAKQNTARLVSPTEAYEFFIYQVLAGDPTDGYPGCRRIGDLKAKAHIAEHGTAWSPLVGLFAKQHKTDIAQATQLALAQARCARILHWTDWDFKNHKVIPWTPKDATT